MEESRWADNHNGKMQRGSLNGEWIPQGARVLPMLTELYYETVDAVLKYWSEEVWASKGRPRLWVKVYDQEDKTGEEKKLEEQDLKSRISDQLIF